MTQKLTDAATPSANTLSGADLFLTVQNGVSKRATGTQLAALAQLLNQNTDTALAEGTANEVTAADIRLLLDTAIPAGLSNLFNVASVAGTATAYTGTALENPSIGRVYIFRPHLTNTAVCSLRINGGTPYSIRDEQGVQLLPGMLKLGVEHLLVFTNDNVFRAIGLARSEEVRSSLQLVGNESGIFIDYRINNTEAFPRARLFFDTDGKVDLFAGGDGTANPPLRWRTQANGDFRTFGNFLTAGNQEVYSAEKEPPLTLASIAGTDAARVIYDLPVPRDDKASAPLTITDTNVVFVTAAHYTGLDINVAGAVLDCQCMPRGVPVPLHVSPSGSVSVYAGPGFTWSGYAPDEKTLQLPANSVAIIHRIRSSSLVLQVITGTVTPSVAAPAARALSVALGVSQSNGVGLVSRGGFYGLQEGMIELAQSPSIWPIQGAFGGSSILKGNAAGVDNYWWDQDLDVAGPLVALSAAEVTAAVSAGQPFPAITVGVIGETDAAYMASSGVTTPTTWRDALIDTIAAYRAAIGNPTQKILLCPVGSQDNVGFAPGGYAAVREALLEIALSDVNFRVGPDTYDVSRRYEEIHMDYQGAREFGRRIAAHIDNWLYAGDNYLGPRIIGMTELSPTSFRIDIESLVGGSPGGLIRPLFPAGFALLPALATPNDIVDATPYTIVRTQWGFADPYFTLTLTTSSPASGARLAYPWGIVGDQRTGRVVRGAGNLPLRSYRP